MTNVKKDTLQVSISEELSDERSVPEYILQRQIAWTTGYRIWNAVYYVLAIGSAVLAAVAAVGWKEKIQPVRASLFVICIASASFSSLLTVLNPKAKAEAYKNALRILESALLKYQSDPTIDKKELTSAMSTANDCLK